MEDVFVQHEELQPMEQTIILAIEVQEQVHQHVTKTTNSIKYIMVQNVSQFIMYATTIIVNQTSLEEGDNGHIKTIVDVQHNV